MTLAADGDVESLLGALMSGILAQSQDEARAVYRAVSNNPVLESARQSIRANDPETFTYLFASELERMVDGLLADELPNSEEAKFLFKHYRFVEAHIERLFIRFEGRPCCVDKARTVLRQLLHFYTAGRRIEFDYTQEYTYHLPTRVLKAHDEIVAFFRALMELHFGFPEKYLKALLNLAEQSSGVSAGDGGKKVEPLAHNDTN